MLLDRGTAPSIRREVSHVDLIAGGQGRGSAPPLPSAALRDASRSLRDASRLSPPLGPTKEIPLYVPDAIAMDIGAISRLGRTPVGLEQEGAHSASDSVGVCLDLALPHHDDSPAQSPQLRDLPVVPELIRPKLGKPV